MRWLKDKKREKRSSSVGYDEDDNDDDYGFEKDKAAQACGKSPTIKRQLPPTPLTPEEISPHIYEEIHDGQIINGSSIFLSGSPIGSRHRVKRVRQSSSVAASQSGSASASSGVYVPPSSLSSKYIGKANALTSSSRDDSISPYMVVPVDEDVRQTPTHFHRNGTPEVHCDVIVKDTHCEILLSRKPKVAAFKPDPLTSGKKTVDNNFNTDTSKVSNPAIRNNTHFCSRNRRASVDVHNLGSKSYSSSSGAWNYSALSSSSTSRVNSVGTSMMSLSTLSERDRLPTLDDNASSDSSAKGILTYTVGGNIIPRTNKLTFNPLKPMDGDDTSLSNQDPFFSMMPPPQSDSSNNKDIKSPTLYSQMSPPLQIITPKNVSNNDNNSNKTNSSNSVYQPPTQPFMNPALEHLPSPKSPNDFIRDSIAALPCNRNPNLISIHGYNPNTIQEKPTHSIIRASSPSNASSCTYASVSFPTEPKIYNTIAPDLISQETTREHQSHTVLRQLETSVEGESETESVRYSSIQDTTQFGSSGVPNQSHQRNQPATSNTFPSRTSREPFQFGAGAGADDSVYSGVLAYRIENNSNNLHSNQTSGFPPGNTQHKPKICPKSDKSRYSASNEANATLHLVSNDLYRQNQHHHSSRMDESASSIIYSGILTENEVVNKKENNDENSSTLYASIETNPSNNVDRSILMPNLNVLSSTPSNNSRGDTCNSLDTTEADVDRLYGEAAGLSNATANFSASATAAAIANSILFDFCTCSDDQHSSDCGGFLDGKADDDASSIATTINEPRGPCTGCGRLIRQITYSESYSDDTYEHVYSSRLLLRRGRRFSSPDITTSEISNPEINREIEDVKRHCLLGAMSRDDSFMSTPRQDGVGLKLNKSEDPITDSKKENVLIHNSSNLEIEVVRSNERLIQTDVRNNSQTPAIPHSKPRQSFSAFGSSTKTLGILGDKITNAHTLAYHRSSLPVIHPSNLVPFTEDTTNFTSNTTSSTQLQTKPGPFSNFFSKLSRPKPKTHNKISDGDNMKLNQKQDDLTTDSNISNMNYSSHQLTPDAPIPEKNTTKLSKFFQLLSSSDGNESKDESKSLKDKKRDDDVKTKGLKVEIPENSITKTSKLLRSPSELKTSECLTSHNKNYLSAFKSNLKLSPDNSKMESSCSNQLKINDQSTVIDVVNTSTDSNSNRPNISGILSSHTNSNEALVDSIIIMNENKNSTGLVATSSILEQGMHKSTSNADEAMKSQNKTKTDSGDTCYEYDISTSSESEQTSYDYVLSKVKKSLNLEHEVQQIADMNAQRRRMFCKKCKKSDVYGSGVCIDNEDNESIGSDNGCPQFSAKFGDLRKIFGDFVVDQRAAILDCLTDYAHGPFSVKGDSRDNTCRGCGGEIMTSDSESMTTVYSILSQQFRRTSPDAHTPSCDSDDGTMADKSCESADDEDNDVSSGYDEAIGPACEQQHQQHVSVHKMKRKEKGRDRKERRLHHSIASSCKDHEKISKRRNSGQSFSPFKTDCHSSESNSSSKPYQGDGNSDNNGIVNGNKYQTSHKQDTLYPTDKSFLSSHSPSSSTVQKNSSKKGGNNSKMKGDSVASNNTNTPTNDKKASKNPNNYTTNDNSNQNKLVCNPPNKQAETGTETNINISNPNNGINNNNSTDNISSKPKPRLLATEKVIQDIYAPLPSKALSWLTARCCNNNNYNTSIHDSLPTVYSCSCKTAPTPHQQYVSSKTAFDFSDNMKIVTCTTLSPSENTEVFSDCKEGGTCVASGLKQIATYDNKDIITTDNKTSKNNNIIVNKNSSNDFDNSSVQTPCGIPHGNNDNDSSAIGMNVAGVEGGGEGTLKMKEDSRHKRSGCGHFGDGSEKLSELHKEEDRLQFDTGVGTIHPNEYSTDDNERVCFVDKSYGCSSNLDDSNAVSMHYQKKSFTHNAGTDNRNIGKVSKQLKDGEYGMFGNKVKKQEALTSRQMQKQLQMVALDLLPETVLGSDADETLSHRECITKADVVIKSKSTEVKTTVEDQQSVQNKQPTQQEEQEHQQHQGRIKSKMVERLTKMFEENSNSNNNKTTSSSPHNTTTAKSENISSHNKTNPSITEAATPTSSSLCVNVAATNRADGSVNGGYSSGGGGGVSSSNCHSDTTHMLIKVTGAINSPGRSYTRETATAPSTAHQTTMAPTINHTADNDNAFNASSSFSYSPSFSSSSSFYTTKTTQSLPPHGASTGSAAAAIFVPVPFVKQQTQKLDSFSHPSPSPSFVKPAQLSSPTTALSNSTTPTTSTTNSDHSGKSPLYNYCSSSSSSLLLLSSSSFHINNTDNNGDGNKNSGFNTTTNTPVLESNTNRTLTLPKPPTPKKPNVYITKSSPVAPTLNSKSERSEKDQLKKGNNYLKFVDNDCANLSLAAFKKPKDCQNNNVDNKLRKNFKSQDFEVNSSHTGSTSSSRKQLVSPSPSSSSGSSSKRNRSGNGGSSNGGSSHGTRQKKLSKRGHPQRRTRSKSERRHKSSHHHHHHHHQERTRYYFSSDLSDIDVIEVEDWETYNSTARAHPSPDTTTISGRDSSSGKPDKVDRRKRGDKNGKHSSRMSEEESSIAATEASADSSMIQEIYSIPPSSSEIREAAAGVDGVCSKEGGNASSPQIVKKSKKTDTIYKSKKNNNKLLSDLIIRNYDRQMYDVGGGNNAGITVVDSTA